MRAFLVISLVFLFSCSDSSNLNQHDCKAIALYVSDTKESNKVELDKYELLIASEILRRNRSLGRDSEAYTKAFSGCVAIH
jgi:hypothetical protein